MASDNPAHVLWVELSTRITTEHLHYRSGDEETAAASVYNLFATVREQMEKFPDNTDFSDLALRLLNQVLRPYTARWHGWMTADDDHRDKDGKPVLKFADEWTRRQFRKELQDLQPRLAQVRDAFAILKAGGKLTPAQTTALPGSKVANQEASLGRVLAPGIQNQVRFAGVKDQQTQDRLTAEINKAEQDCIKARLGLVADSPLMDATGLAFSGGGIRSATYCLGITQVLVKRGLLPQFGYLSTVSGGGYFGSFLSSYLGTGDFTTTVKDKDKIAPEEQKAEARERLKAAFDPDDKQRESPAIRHMRNRSRYLLDGEFWKKVTEIGMVVAGVLFNLLIVLPFPVLAALATRALYNSNWFGDHCWIEIGDPWLPDWAAPCTVGLRWAAGATTVLVLLFPLLKGLALMGLRKLHIPHLLKIWEWCFRIASSVMLFLLAMWLVPVGFRLYASVRSFQLPEWMGVVKDHMEQVLAAVGLSMTALLNTLASRAAKLGGGSRWFKKVAILTGPLLFLLVYFGVGYRIMFAAGEEAWPWETVVWITAAMLAWAWFFVNVNTYSPHGFYRDRLSECYLLVRNKKKDGTLELASNDRVRLSAMGACIAAPYHLINTTLNVPSSSDRQLRGRNADFFLFSKHYCGSPMVGYHLTTELESADSHLDLGTAMAISGAAASSNMGWQTDHTTRLIMTLANVRLGYWLKNPRNKCVTPLLTGPGPLYLFREMFASQMDENRNYLNLSDGGHHENLAVYELLRRRCKFIVCVDGGCEPEMQCVDLIRLERYAAIDLGIKMHYDITDLLLQPNGFSRAFAVLVKIDYDPPADEAARAARKPGDASWGWMLYLKLAMVGYGPGYVMDYKRLNPAFPHQSTSDQLYDEAQFEAYRALGEFAAESMFREEITRDHDVTNLPGWFTALASNLLPDNDEAFK